MFFPYFPQKSVKLVVKTKALRQNCVVDLLLQLCWYNQQKCRFWNLVESLFAKEVRNLNLSCSAGSKLLSWSKSSVRSVNSVAKFLRVLVPLWLISLKTLKISSKPSKNSYLFPNFPDFFAKKSYLTLNIKTDNIV